MPPLLAPPPGSPVRQLVVQYNREEAVLKLLLVVAVCEACRGSGK